MKIVFCGINIQSCGNLPTYFHREKTWMCEYFEKLGHTVHRDKKIDTVDGYKEYDAAIISGSCNFWGGYTYEFTHTNIRRLAKIDIPCYWLVTDPVIYPFDLSQCTAKKPKGGEKMATKKECEKVMDRIEVVGCYENFNQYGDALYGNNGQFKDFPVKGYIPLFYSAFQELTPLNEIRKIKAEKERQVAYWGSLRPSRKKQFEQFLKELPYGTIIGKGMNRMGNLYEDDIEWIGRKNFEQLQELLRDFRYAIWLKDNEHDYDAMTVRIFESTNNGLVGLCSDRFQTLFPKLKDTHINSAQDIENQIDKIDSLGMDAWWWLFKQQRKIIEKRIEKELAKVTHKNWYVKL